MAANPGSEAEAAKPPSPPGSDAAPDFAQGNEPVTAKTSQPDEVTATHEEVAALLDEVPTASRNRNASVKVATEAAPAPMTAAAPTTPQPLTSSNPLRAKTTGSVPAYVPTLPPPGVGPGKKPTPGLPAFSSTTPAPLAASTTGRHKIPPTQSGSAPTASNVPAAFKISAAYPAFVADPSGAAPPPTPTPLTSRGLHAPASTPGPVSRQFVTIGRYQLLSRLAVGGMAEVYLARQGELSGFKTLVVVKKVLPHLAVKPDFIAMFLDEARIASMLDHPNIVRITEVGRAGDEYFLAMELVQGKPLAQMLQYAEKAKTPLPHNLAALVVANAAAGLHHAHQLMDASGHPLGLVHRDVSPQNIMVSFEGSVKVIDFGIARALGRLGDTTSGSLKGKLGYMAPEQARGEPVDARADLFSLGVVLWECVAGRRLFLRENELATLRGVVYEPIPSVGKYVEVDPALDAIVRRSVTRNIDERFQTAEEMRIALERWVFSCGGASTHDLATLMKSWFPAEHVQWQRAARLALDMQESDPPIEVSFPNLSTGKSGHSHTGTGRVDGVGSAGRFHAESSSRSYQPPLLAPIAPAPVPAPKKSWLHFAMPAGIGLSLLGAGALALALSTRRPVVDSSFEAHPTEAKPAAAVRPTVEILPGGEAMLNNQTAHQTPSPSPGSAPSTESHTVGTENAVEPARTPSESAAALAAKKKHASTAEKRAILRNYGRVPKARPSFKNPSGISSKPLRPNPF